jgi:hypothetical protein
MKLLTITLYLLLSLSLNLFAADSIFITLLTKRLDPNDKNSDGEVIDTIQGQASSEGEFYFRTVSSGIETLMTGKVGAVTGKKNEFSISLNYQNRRLGSFAETRKVVSGKEIMRVRQEKLVQAADGYEDPTIRYYLQVQNFFPPVGRHFINADWSVRLVDEKGKPVPNARTSMYDEEGNMAHGIISSDDNGMVERRILEEMPRLTFVAESQNPHLLAIVHLNRDQAGKPFQVIMRSNLPWPKNLKDKLFE